MTPLMDEPQKSPSHASPSATPRRTVSRLRPRARATLAPASALTVALVCGLPTLASANIPSNPITDYAGIGNSQALATPGPATSSHLSYPQGLAVDTSGNLYVVDPGAAEIDRVTPSGTLSIFVGNGTGTSGAPTPGPATSSTLNNPQQAAFDSSGNLYIADANNNEVEKVTPSGTLSIFAGTGTAGAPTPGPATASELHAPAGVAVDSNGNVYISDQGNNEIDKVTPSGTLSIFATGFNAPWNIAVDSSNNVYVDDWANQKVDKVTPGGTVSTIAGTGVAGNPTPGPATSSMVHSPQGIAVDASGNVYIGDSYAFDLLKVTPGGTLSVLAGTNSASGPTYGGPATSSAVRSPYGVAVDSSGVIYIADGSWRTVDRIGPTTPAPPTIISATPGQGSIALTFNPPVSDGTSLITSYEASTDGGTTWHSITTASGSGGSLLATLSGLTIGSTYSVVVRADNTSGAGTASSQSSVTLPLPTTSTTTTGSTTASTTTSATSATTTTSTTTTTSAPPPNSAFTAGHVPYVNTTTGAIALFDSVQNPGTLTWRALYRNSGGVAGGCPAFQVRKGGQCRPEWLVYGQGSSQVTSAGMTPFAISPGARARKLLRWDRRHGRAGVPLAVVVTFQSAYGGPSVTHIMTVLATLHPHGKP